MGKLGVLKKVLIMYILGISCYYHDFAAALLKYGLVVAIVEDERFSREKTEMDFLVMKNYVISKSKS